MPHIGQVIRQKRDAAELSGNDVEKLTHGELKQSWIASLEAGRIANPAEPKLKLLAQVLGTSVTEIYRLAGRIDLPDTGLFEDEDEIVRIYRASSPRNRTIILSIMRTFAEAEEITVEAPRSTESPERAERDGSREGKAVRA